MRAASSEPGGGIGARRGRRRGHLTEFAGQSEIARQLQETDPRGRMIGRGIGFRDGEGNLPAGGGGRRVSKQR